MATLKEGVLGGFSGQVGPVVGASWKGVPYIRSLPSNWKDTKSDKQVRQRSRFSVSMSFLKGITPFIRIGFQSYAEGRMTAFNGAMSYNMTNAVKAGEEGLELDYAKVLVSQGPLGAASEVQVGMDGCELQFSWKSGSLKNTRHDDIAMLLVHNPAKCQSVYDINAGKRENRKANLSLPASWKGDAIETFLAFKNADGSEVSDSVYAGQHWVD